MVELRVLKKRVTIFIVLLIVAAVLFSVFSYVTVSTDVNVIEETITFMRTAVAESLGVALDRIQLNIREIYGIIVLQTILFGTAIIVSLFAINHLVYIYVTLKKKVLLDELTGIYNKRALHHFLDKEISRAKRFKHPLTIIMLDIDFFKVYNDKNGHLAGDMLLKKLAGLISKKMRDVDILARYGGEEFTIILPETPHDEAVKVAERIRKTIETTHFKGEEKQPKGKITISMGLATFHGEYKSKKYMLSSADQMLYKAKEEGRNQLQKAYFGKK